MERQTNKSLKIYKDRICIVIPTYNNCKTLKRVVDGVLRKTKDILIINDGSTDETASILQHYPGIKQIHLEKNKGKGNALAMGFKWASENEYNYALTIDSDGQHFSEDITNFVEYLEQSENKNILLIGSRDMDGEDIPAKSGLGNRFSNFWFWFETGIKLTDTQSGFRLYPLRSIPKRFYTNKFEFEIEIIVRSAWKNVEIRNIPIRVLYDRHERVSHFRPFRDFTRISILNTALVFVKILYITPLNLVQRFKKKNFKSFLKEDVLGSNDSNLKKSLSIALGAFIGIIPVWGFQTFLAIFLAIFFRLNKALTFFSSNISIPPLIPIIVYASLFIGFLVVPNPTKQVLIPEFSVNSISEHILQYLAGSFVLASLVAITLGGISYIILTLLQKKQ